MTTTSDDPIIDDDTVVAYLERERGFFERHPEMISKLELPHESGSATSLVERQVSLLRERNIDLGKQLNELVDNAGVNDNVFLKTRTLTLALMDTVDLQGLDQVLATRLIEGFDADHGLCYVLDWQEPANYQHIVGVPANDEPPIPRLFSQPEPVCGIYRPNEYGALFPDSHLTEPGSVALVPMRLSGLEAILAIGSNDSQRFVPEKGTLFLEYISDVLSRTLNRVMQ